jgi:HEAT repeat protein
VTVILVGSVLLVPASRWTLIGWIRGESFYQGRPTSYWSQQIRAYQHRVPPSSIDRLMATLGLSAPNHREPPLEAMLGQEPDPAAVPVLTELLGDPDDQVRYHAANTLSHCGPKAGAAVPALVKMLRDPNIYDRRNAAKTLAHIGPAAKEAVPDLIEALKDEDEWVLYHVAMALGRIGPDAREAVPGLIQVLRSDKAEHDPFNPEGLEGRVLVQTPDSDKAARFTLMKLTATVGDAAAYALKEIDPQAAAEAGVP